MAIEQKKLKNGEKRYRASVYHLGDRIKGDWHKLNNQAKYDEAVLTKELSEGLFVKKTSKLFSEITEDYFSLIAPRNMNETNLYNEWSLYQKHIAPTFGSRKITSIKPIEIQKWLATKEKTYANSYVVRMCLIMNKVFKQAQSWEFMKFNPMDRVDKPKIKYKRFDTWTKKEITKFLNQAEGYHSYIVFWLAINTGMRLGEILGLHWSDINFHEKYIDLTEGLDRRTGKRTSLKTKASERYIYLSKSQINILKEHKVSQTIDTEIVCASKVGSYMMHRNVRRAMETICKKSGVKKIRFHDLRHTHATLLSQIEKNPRIVQERLGHADVRMTLDVYTHVQDTSHKQSANSFSDFLTKK
ncbi:site-specific integrase [Marinilactibacillus sp. Marseille-P9653]|uniref:tyrosine-type recombinase/integrase n=1 Tax=Marinilactibacillus sp. Marseille-P9653 TaxID=2866583 RepID=UPI001CE47280|nr:site-specific integrase [Marinilactibacillus sp. Marseille-P9653]